MSASVTGLVGGSRGGDGGSRRRRALARLGAAGLVVALVGGMPATAAYAGAGAATVAAPGTIHVTGELSGSGHFVFECDYVHDYRTATGTLSGLGPVTMDYEYCVALGEFPWDPYRITRGTFTITAASGTLTGDVAGEVKGYPPDREGLFPVQLIFTVTGSTGDLDGAGGSLTFETLDKYIEPDRHRMIGTGGGTLTLPG